MVIYSVLNVASVIETWTFSVSSGKFSSVTDTSTLDVSLGTVFPVTDTSTYEGFSGTETSKFSIYSGIFFGTETYTCEDYSIMTSAVELVIKRFSLVN